MEAVPGARRATAGAAAKDVRLGWEVACIALVAAAVALLAWLLPDSPW